MPSLYRDDVVWSFLFAKALPAALHTYDVEAQRRAISDACNAADLAVELTRDEVQLRGPVGRSESASEGWTPAPAHGDADSTRDPNSDADWPLPEPWMRWKRHDEGDWFVHVKGTTHDHAGECAFSPQRDDNWPGSLGLAFPALLPLIAARNAARQEASDV